MPERFTNLLPPNRQHLLVREYFVRLGTIVVWTITMLVIVAGLFLIPSYVYLTANIHVKEGRLASIESVLSSSDATALSARLAALSNDAATLIALKDVPSVSNTIRNLLGIAHTGITLSSIAYSSAAGTNTRTLAVTGTATTRDALRNYQLALQSAPFAKAADLPVSAYAKDADIPFTITVTLAP